MNIKKIGELTVGLRNLWLKNVKVVENEGLKVIRVGGEPVEICNAVVEDSTGKVHITAFGEASKLLAVAVRIDLEGGCCKQYFGKLRVSTGRYGKINIIEEET